VVSGQWSVVDTTLRHRYGGLVLRDVLGLVDSVFRSEVSMLKAIRHIDYVVLLSDDILRMKQFYHEIMGFPIYRDWGNWIELRVGSVLLALRHRDRPYDGPSFQPHSAAVQLAFRVTPTEVDVCYTELREHAVEILEPPIMKEYGHKTLFFKDPEGNVLEIYADI
jgi:catechol-2,3-dioxygenase